MWSARMISCVDEKAKNIMSVARLNGGSALRGVARRASHLHFAAPLIRTGNPSNQPFCDKDSLRRVEF